MEKNAILEEYKSLRDETLKRVEFRYQIFSLTLIIAGSLLTVGTADNGPRTVLLIYPILSFFFSASFVYNSMLLVQIGAYIRDIIEESNAVNLGWAKYLKTRYGAIEPFEIISTYGLFLGTQVVALIAFFSYNLPIEGSVAILLTISLIAVVLTFITLLWPVIYHRGVLSKRQTPDV
jgi:hypothetical protein